jgi:hypothetical protein
MVERRNTYKVLAVNRDGKTGLVRYRHKWDD